MVSNLCKESVTKLWSTQIAGTNHVWTSSWYSRAAPMIQNLHHHSENSLDHIPSLGMMQVEEFPVIWRPLMLVRNGVLIKKDVLPLWCASPLFKMIPTTFISYMYKQRVTEWQLCISKIKCSRRDHKFIFSEIFVSVWIHTGDIAISSTTSKVDKAVKKAHVKTASSKKFWWDPRW